MASGDGMDSIEFDIMNARKNGAKDGSIIEEDGKIF